MAVVLIDLDPVLYDDITAVLSKYRDMTQFFEVAARNQLALERQSRATDDLAPVAAGTRSRRVGQPAGPAKTPSTSAFVEGAEVGATDWRRWVTKRDDLPEDERPEPTVAEGVLWGQTNRVLPIAVGVRVLAHLSADVPDGRVPRNEWYELAVKVAQALRPQLEAWDRAGGRKRGELWSTAFPSTDPASANRYIGQFLGAPRKRERLPEGGAGFLGLVEFLGLEDSAPVVLTTSGAAWAALSNPIFDGGADGATFSPEEARFFVEHLRRYRPDEYQLMALTARLVAEGRSRTEIDQELAEVHPEWAGFITTMRAGEIGRLSDLGLLARTRHGLQVEYRLTDLAADLGLGKDAQA